MSNNHAWNSYGEFEELWLSNTVWDDLRFPATTYNPPGTLSDPTWDDTNIGWIMANNNILYFIAQFSHKKKLQTSVHPHIHWEQTEAGNVHWQLQYEWVNNGGTLSGSYTTINTTDQVFTYSAGRIMQWSEFPTISPPADEAVSSIIKIKLLRINDGDDTYGTDPVLNEFDIHFEINSLGSRDEYIK